MIFGCGNTISASIFSGSNIENVFPSYLTMPKNVWVKSPDCDTVADQLMWTKVNPANVCIERFPVSDIEQVLWIFDGGLLLSNGFITSDGIIPE